MNPTNTNPTVRIYACGGAGINIANSLSGISSPALFAPFNICYIDSSRSNIANRKIEEDSLFLFDGLDGSGKKRSENAKAIAAATPAILQQFQAADLNIVIHSTSGGTGSVAGPCIVGELKANGKDVIVLMVGDDASTIEASNSFKTFETYDAIAKLHKSSVVLDYYPNNVGGRHKSDKDVIYTACALLALYGGHHAELDSKDLNSWLSYATTTVDVPTIATLSIISDEAPIHKLDKVVSVITLATPTMNTRIDLPIQYQTVGYVPSSMLLSENNNAGIIGDSPMHYVLSFDALKTQYADLRKKVEENEAALRAITKSNTDFSGSAAATSNGLVL